MNMLSTLAAVAAPPLEDNAVAEGFGEFIARLTKGEFGAETWLLFWESAGKPLALAIVLIVAVLLVSGWARKLVTKAAEKARVEITLARFFGTLAKWVVVAVGGVVILGTLGIETTSFAAVLAAVGFAIGMALSGTLSHVASGVLLLIFRPYKVGDYIVAAGVEGVVHEIGMFTTEIDTLDHRRVIVPNGQLFGSTIENVTHHPKRRVDVDVGVAYDADIDAARTVLEKACAETEGVLSDPAPTVYLMALGGSSVDFQLRGWCNTGDYWEVRQQLTRSAKVALDAAGISIPFPQRDLHLPGEVRVRVENG